VTSWCLQEDQPGPVRQPGIHGRSDCARRRVGRRDKAQAYTARMDGGIMDNAFKTCRCCRTQHDIAHAAGEHAGGGGLGTIAHRNPNMAATSARYPLPPAIAILPPLTVGLPTLACYALHHHTDLAARPLQRLPVPLPAAPLPAPLYFAFFTPTLAYTPTDTPASCPLRRADQRCARAIVAFHRHTSTRSSRWYLMPILPPGMATVPIIA